jgi:hypothetical protein
MKKNASADVLAVTCLIAMLFFEGCTSVKVRPVDGNLGVSNIYIIENKDVSVDDFLTVLIKGCSRHGINTSVVSVNFESGEKDFVLVYSANRSWDFAPYLSQAKISIYKNILQVGSAEYRLIGDGGFSLYKWQGTETKIGPVMDELLQNYKLAK